MNRFLLTVITTLSFSTIGLLDSPSAHAQRVVDVTPNVNSRSASPETSISGVFEEVSGESVKPDSVKIYLNGQDVTGRSTVTRGFFSYRPDTLAPGDYTVRVDYASSQGQLRSASWMFSVQPQATLEIAEISHNAAEGIGVGSTLLVTMNGTGGGQASVLLVEDGRTVRQIQAQETSAGIYTATLPVNANNTIREGIIVGRLSNRDQVTYDAAKQPAIFSGAVQAAPTVTDTAVVSNPSATVSNPAPQTGTLTTTTPAQPVLLAPTLTSHQDGDRIQSRGFTLAGETSPYATVDALVTATTPILGGFVNVSGSELVNQTLRADANGKFEIQVPAPTVLQSGTRYSIELTAQLNEQSSNTTRLRLQQR